MRVMGFISPVSIFSGHLNRSCEEEFLPVTRLIKRCLDLVLIVDRLLRCECVNLPCVPVAIDSRSLLGLNSALYDEIDFLHTSPLAYARKSSSASCLLICSVFTGRSSGNCACNLRLILEIES